MVGDAVCPGSRKPPVEALGTYRRRGHCVVCGVEHHVTEDGVVRRHKIRAAADAHTNPDEFLAHAVKATESLMLIRVYRAANGKLESHYASGEYSGANPMAIMELAHAATGCCPGGRVPPPPGAPNELAEAWDTGYAAARDYTAQREEDRRVFERHGIEGSHIPDPPRNPHRPDADWDF